MAGLPAKIRTQSTNIKAAAFWGVTAATGGLYLVQPWAFLKRTFFEKPEPEQK